MAAYAALVSLMRIINNLQSHPSPPIFLDARQAESLTERVGFLLEFLEGYNPQLPYSREADPLESRIANAAYSAEYAIESHIFDQFTNNGENMSYDDLYKALKEVIEDMASIEEEARNSRPPDSWTFSSLIPKIISSSIYLHMLRSSSVTGVLFNLVAHQVIKKATLALIREVQQCNNSRPPDSSTSSSIPQPPDSSTSSSIPQQSSMVGADDVKLQLMEKLIFDDDLQIIPIVGLGGSGKTTLARTVYEGCLNEQHFDICGWATISHEYNIREIFAVLLRQFEIRDDDLNEDALGENLYKHLFSRRYLIVMDDIWSIEAWDAVRNYFPNNKNGSRIVVTTRLADLASTLANSNSIEMKLLDEADSWFLLYKIVFGNGSCPLELEEIGKRIGRNCKGLPLSIVVVGGLLAKSEQTREFWEYIGENLNAIVNLEDDERCLKILYMSYQQLPIHLKPCFLYMGVFPKDELISISKLIKVWSVEGFIKPIGGKSLEEIAEENLKALIGRNLIMSHKMGITGKMKYCKIHDLLRDLCLREAQKERFYNIASDNEAISASPSMSQAIGKSLKEIAKENLKDFGTNLIVSGITGNMKYYIIHELLRNLHSREAQKIFHNITSNNEALPSMSQARCLTWDVRRELSVPCMSLLRIVETRRFHVDRDFYENVDQLVNSRSLEIFTPVERDFPSSIWRFWNLQTLIVYNSNEATAPTDFWYMTHIRHVEVHRLRLPNPPNDQDDIVLGNLQRLGIVYGFKCSEQVVRKIPNIKKLVFYNEGNLDDDMYYLNNLDGLTKLESLDCTFSSRISFPLSIKRLVLRGTTSRDDWEVLLDKIGVLPRLQKLKLDWGRFNKGAWETIEGQFCSLKSLHLYGCENLKEWIAESSHFPCLEQLHLHELHEWMEIPSDFEYLQLREIVVLHCSDSVVKSAKRILEAHEDYYEEGVLQVDVQLSRDNDAGLKRLESRYFRVQSF